MKIRFLLFISAFFVFLSVMSCDKDCNLSKVSKKETLLLGIDFNSNNNPSRIYNYYLKDGKEVLHGESYLLNYEISTIVFTRYDEGVPVHVYSTVQNDGDLSFKEFYINFRREYSSP